MPISISFDTEPDLHTGCYKGITDGIPRILNALERYSIKATFFTTCDCIEKYPRIFRTLSEQGHEIALHGYRHQRFDELSLSEKEDQISKSISCFIKYLKQKPAGFRAPQFSIDEEMLNLLQKYGFSYDSSCSSLDITQFFYFPGKFRHYWSLFFSSKKIRKIRKNLREIPPTSLLIPFNSLILRILPVLFTKIFFHKLKFFNKNIIFYAHSWDFIELPESKIARKYPLNIFIKKFDKFLNYASRKNKFCRMIDLAR